jgi:hypothetical protein
LKIDLQRKKLAANSFTNFVGRMGFAVLAVLFTKLGKRVITFINADNAVIGARLLPALYFRILESRCGCGSEQFGTLQVKSMV